MSPAKPTRKAAKLSDNSSIKRLWRQQEEELKKRIDEKQRELEAEEAQLEKEEEDRKRAEKEQKAREDAEKVQAAAQKKAKGGRKSGGGWEHWEEREDVRKVRAQTVEDKKKELRDGVLQAGE